MCSAKLRNDRTGVNRPARRKRIYNASIPHNRHVISDRDHILNVMGDESQRPPFGTQRRDHSEQPALFWFVQHCGWLIEHDHAWISDQRLGHLQQLLRRNGQVTDSLLGVDAKAQPVQYRSHSLALIRGRQPGEWMAMRLESQDQIGSDGQVVGQREFLKYDRNAELARSGYRADLRFSAVDQDLAMVLRMHSTEELGQRRFARAVFTEYAVNGSAVEGEADIVKRKRCRESLAEVSHLEERLLADAAFGGRYEGGHKLAALTGACPTSCQRAGSRTHRAGRSWHSPP